jgi:hypothetical protein
LDNLDKLIDDHWEYIKELLIVHGYNKECQPLREIAFHYKTAFKHGYKHAKEEMNEKLS